MSAKQEAQDWADTVRKYGEKHDLRYEEIGGINPKDGPVALCVGGTNRLTGELAPEFWGASCDADEHEAGGLFSKAVLPGAVIVKAQVPDLAKVMPPFNVESIEHRPDELAIQKVARKVEFESIERIGRGGNRFALGKCGKQTCDRRTTSPGAFKQLRGSASPLRSDL